MKFKMQSFFQNTLVSTPLKKMIPQKKEKLPKAQLNKNKTYIFKMFFVI